MASIKLKFRPSSYTESEGYLFFQVIHDRKVRQIGTGIRIFLTEWDEAGSKVVDKRDADPVRRVYLQRVRRDIGETRQRLDRIVDYFESLGVEYSARDIVECYRNHSGGFRDFTMKVVAEMRRLGRVRSMETYMSAINSFMRYRDGMDLPLTDINQSTIMGYDRYLRSKGLSGNTVSFYMRNLRAVYNRAVDEGLVEQTNPFRRVYTGVAKTVKRAIPLKDVRRLKRLDLSDTPLMEYARDMFMFSFYTRGMSFVDMAYLRKDDLSNGMLTYKRRKTGQRLLIRWEREMGEIVKRYGQTDSPYMLPIIRNVDNDTRKQYRSASHYINARLKSIGVMLKLPVPLTMYVARHAWASIAWSQNVSISVISEAMGHDSEQTTRIYLAAIDTSSVDRANSRIIKLLLD